MNSYHEMFGKDFVLPLDVLVLILESGNYLPVINAICDVYWPILSLIAFSYADGPNPGVLFRLLFCIVIKIMLGNGKKFSFQVNIIY